MSVEKLFRHPNLFSINTASGILLIQKYWITLLIFYIVVVIDIVVKDRSIRFWKVWRKIFSCWQSVSGRIVEASVVVLRLKVTDMGKKMDGTPWRNYILERTISGLYSNYKVKGNGDFFKCWRKVMKNPIVFKFQEIFWSLSNELALKRSGYLKSFGRLVENTFKFWNKLRYQVPTRSWTGTKQFRKLECQLLDYWEPRWRF